jgi:hypothetical protein
MGLHGLLEGEFYLFLTHKLMMFEDLVSSLWILTKFRNLHSNPVSSLCFIIFKIIESMVRSRMLSLIYIFVLISFVLNAIIIFLFRLWKEVHFYFSNSQILSLLVDAL